MIQGARFGENGQITLSYQEVSFCHPIVSNIKSRESKDENVNIKLNFDFQQIHVINNDVKRYITSLKETLVDGIVQVYEPKKTNNIFWVQYGHTENATTTNQIGCIRFKIHVITKTSDMWIVCIESASSIGICDVTKCMKYSLGDYVFCRMDCIQKRVHMLHDCFIGRCTVAKKFVNIKKSGQSILIEKMIPLHSSSNVYILNKYYSKS